jgi:plasmid stabilization system protein ParE
LKYVLSRAASEDIRAITEWIAKDNPVRSVSFARELLMCCRKLTTASERYPIIRADVTPPVRRRNYRRYAICYTVLRNHIHVIAVVHGARDVMSVIEERLD